MSLCRGCKPGCESNYYAADNSCPRCRRDALIILAVQLFAIALVLLLMMASKAGTVGNP
jgi:hypothetical protein